VFALGFVFVVIPPVRSPGKWFSFKAEIKKCPSVQCKQQRGVVRPKGAGQSGKNEGK